MLGISDLIEIGHLEPIEIYSVSTNRFGEIVGYFEDDGQELALVSFEPCHHHCMPTRGELSTAAELPLSDLIMFGSAAIKQPPHSGRS